MQLRDARSRLSRSLFTIPLITLLIILILGMLKVSGSSIALHSETDSSAELVGQPRPVRSDEWITRTPLVVRQAALDFPADTDLGVGTHDTGVLSDLPAKSPAALVKPHSWPYFVVDVERAFAIEWWLSILGPFIGVYSVLAVITRSRLISSLAGLLATAAPAMLWWTIPATGLSVLYGGMIATFLIAACRRQGWRRYVRAGIAGWFAAAFAALLYLPWLVPLAILFGTLVLVMLPAEVKGWRQLVVLAGAFGGVFAVLMAIYYRQHHIALQAISNSVYPGNRVTVGGEARPSVMFDAPYDVFATAPKLATLFGTNTSEAASGLMLWLPIVMVGGTITGYRSTSSTQRALAVVSLVSVVFAAWAFLPVPTKLGELLGLTSVQGSRLALPLTVAGALAGGLFVHRMREDGAVRPATGRIVLGTLTFAAVTARAGQLITINGADPSRRSVLVLMILFTLAVLAVLKGKALVGLGGTCALVLFGSVRINPIQIGLGPITKDPLLAQIDSARVGHETARWASLGRDFHENSILVASGAPITTGVSWYADKGTWDKIDPAESSRQIWDRFALVLIELDGTITNTTFELVQDDYIVLHTPPCAGALQDLDVGYVVVGEEIDSSCLLLVSKPTSAGQRWIYQVVPPIDG